MHKHKTLHSETPAGAAEPEQAGAPEPGQATVPEPGQAGAEGPPSASVLAWLEDRLRGRETPKVRQLTLFVSTSPRLVSYAPVAEVAARVGVNTATVVRFAQALGFSGWKEFQLHFRHRYLSSLMPTQVVRDHPQAADESPLTAAIQQDIANLRTALTSVDLTQAEAIARAIVAARRTLVVSSGSFAGVGHVLAHLGTVMGFPISLEMRGGVHVAAALSHLEPGDCLVAISFWRSTKDVVQAARYARARGITTAAITDSVLSPLANAVDHVVAVPSEGTSFFQSTTASLSVVYGLLAHMRLMGGSAVDERIARVQHLWTELDILHTE